jgi:hypothetical protein
MPAHSAGHRVSLLHSFPRMPWFFIAIFALSLPISRPAFAQTATTTTLSVTSGSGAVTSVNSGTVVTLTATVLAGSTPVTPGQVKFCDATATYCEDFHIVGTAQLTSSGIATVKFRPTVGSHSYKAVFVGTNTNATSSSQASSLSVTSGLNPTTTSLAYSTVTSSPTQLTATVVGTGLLSSAPTGAVSFVNATNSNAPLGSANLTSQGIGMWASALPAISGYGNWTAAVADFNGDGIPDIAVYAYNELIIFLGSANGAFTEVTTPIVPITNIADVQLVVGDFNQDGIPDLAINTNGSTLTIYSGNGDGTFTAGATYPLNTYSNYLNNYVLSLSYPPIVSADFNHDGILDLAVVTTNSNELNADLTILLGKGDGTFTTVAGLTGLYTQGQLLTLAAGDFNGDGIPDVAIAVGQNNENEDGNINTYLGKGDGTFNPTPSATVYLNADPINMVVADFNGDGRPDIAVDTDSWDEEGVPAQNTISLFLANGNGNFTGGPVQAETEQVSYIYLGNFTGDVNPELWAVGDLGADGTYLFVYNPATGTFDETSARPQSGSYSLSQLKAEFSMEGVIAADINGDGITDFVAPSFIDATSSISTGSVSTSGFPSGGYTIQADYPGDSNFAPSTASIGRAQSTTFTLTVSPSSGLTAGQATTLTATLSPYSYSGGSTNGESITFYEPNTPGGGKFLGTAKLSNGVASIVTHEIPVGTYPLWAGYSGDSSFSASTSNYVSVTVAKDQPTLALSVSPSSGVFGETTTLTATFTGYNIGNQAQIGSVAGEEVEFVSGTQLLGTASLDFDGVATLSTSTVPAGTNSITATYPGDVNNLSATSNAVSYTVTPNPPVITSPTPGSQLSGSSVNFTWTPGGGVSAYQIAAGTYGPGYFNLGGSPQLSSSTTSYTATNLPTDGKPVYITLRYEINGVWQTTDYTYTAAPLANPPVMTSPTPGSVLTGSSVTFTWKPSSAVTAYSLSAGTYGPGYYNLGGSPQLPALAASYTMTDLPTDGKPVYITLRYLVNGAVWQTTDYTYTAASLANPPAITSPTPGTVLPGSSVTFQWTPNSAATAYSIFAGTYGPGYFNLGGSPQLPASATSYTLTNIPTIGKPVYITLRYLVNGAVWQTTDYTYTASQ